MTSGKFKCQFILFTSKVCLSDIPYFDVGSYGNVLNETLLLLVSIKHDSVSPRLGNSYLFVTPPSFRIARCRNCCEERMYLLAGTGIA